MIWAMIGKLSEVTPWWSKWGANERPHRCSHMAYTSHPAPERTHHPSFHCSAPCPYPLWAVTLCSPCLEFRASLRSSHSTQQQSSEQDTENHSSLHSHSELGERHPEDPASLSDWHVSLETLIGQWVLPLFNVKVCFLSKAGPFPDLWSPFQLISISACPGGRNHHSSSGYSAASSSPLWAIILTSDLAWTFFIALAFFSLKSRWVVSIAHYSSCIVGINLTQEWKGGQAINIKKEF